jgi:hypothetical protein
VHEGRTGAAYCFSTRDLTRRTDLKGGPTVPSPDLARQIADVDVQIAEIEARIFQHQKRVENLLAKGGDAAESRATIASLATALAGLEAQKKALQRQARNG